MRYLLVLVFLFAAAAHGSNSRRYNSVVRVEKPEGTETSDADETRCFHYTWLANENTLTFLPFENKTCFDKYASKPPVPLCVNPMVVTDNRQEPNTTWLIDNKRDVVTCIKSLGYTCAKYTYKFNGEVENVTRYCTKISVNDGSMESGCVTSNIGAYETEVCACDKMLGNIPCNGARPLAPSRLATPLLALTAFLLLTRRSILFH